MLSQAALKFFIIWFKSSSHRERDGYLDWNADDDEEEIDDGETGEEQIRDALHLLHLGDGEDDERIAQNAEDEREGIDDEGRKKFIPVEHRKGFGTVVIVVVPITECISFLEIPGNILISGRIGHGW